MYRNTSLASNMTYDSKRNANEGAYAPHDRIPLSTQTCSRIVISIVGRWVLILIRLLTLPLWLLVYRVSLDYLCSIESVQEWQRIA